LPAPGISPDTVAHVEQSLASYCEAQAGQLRQKLHDIWLEARRALLTGSIFLAVCLLLSSMKRAHFRLSSTVCSARVS